MKQKNIVSALVVPALLAPLMGQTILLPQLPNVEEQKAASELQLHLQKALGKKVPIVSEAQVSGAAAPCLFVGNTSFAQKHGLSAGQFKAEQWRLKSQGKDVILVGGAPQGTLYAVFEFLERYVQVLWLDERTTVIPPLSSWPEGIDVQGQPSFRIRGLYAYFRDRPQARQTFMIRNRQNLFHDEGSTEFLRSWNLYPVFGSPRACHTYYNYSKDWGKEHEDCFSMTSSGKRLRATSASGPGQICFTNPKTVDLVTEKLREFIRRDRARYGADHTPMVYELSANDNGNKCECPSCLAAAKKYGSYGGVVLAFTNAVARRIRPEYPDVMIEMFAYTFAEEAPTGIRAEPNVLVRVAQLGTEFSGIRDTLRPLSHPNNAESLRRIQAWKRLATLAIWDYWIMYHKKPTVSECYPAIGTNLKLYEELGMRSVFVEVESPMTTCFYPLRIWLGLQCLNRAQLDVEAAVTRFMDAYYQQAAGAMTELLRLILRRNQEITEKLNDLQLAHRRDLDDAFFKQAYELLEKALDKATEPKLRKRIVKERLVIDQVRLQRRKQLAPCDLEALIQRIRTDLTAQMPDWIRASQAKAALAEFERSVAGLNVKVPVPKEFATRQVAVDLVWPELNVYNQTSIQSVPDAADGKALVLKEDGRDKGALVFGYYDGAGKRFVHNITIARDKVPQDEAFHFYHVGRVTLTKRCRVWAHWTWRIHRDLEEYFHADGRANDYDLYISLKAQGPIYVDGSTKPNALMLDRIMLLK